VALGLRRSPAAAAGAVPAGSVLIPAAAALLKERACSACKGRLEPGLTR